MNRSVVHRRGTPKSRNGCVTCKIRRVKCDEARPGCIRCSSTGRKCDGYIVASRKTQPRSIQLPDPSAMHLSRTSALPISNLERRSLDFFRSRTVIDIAAHFDSPLWSILVLQASHSEPAVQYAATALGALHEKVEHQRSVEIITGQRQRIDIDFPIRQYTKALLSIRNLLDRSDMKSIELVLVSCLLCIYYELLQNNHLAAWTHLEKALKVMKLPWHSPRSCSASRVPHYPVSLVAVDEDLIQAFIRLDVQASSYLSRRRPRLPMFIMATDIPVRFTSLRQSRDALYWIIGQLHYFMWSAADKLRRGPSSAIPLSAAAEIYNLKQLLETWTASFSSFLDQPSTKLTRQEECATKVLLIQHILAYIKTFSCLYADESIFDQFDDEFNKILSHAESLLSNDKGTDPPRFHLSLDVAIIEALFGTAIKCRSNSIRHRAAALLRQVNWREGVWDASLLSRIADHFITAQETVGNPQEISAQAPQFWHADAFAFTVDWNTLHVKLFCNRPLSERDRTWMEQMNFHAW